MLNLAQAGNAVGKSKVTILRAIRAGKLSATRDSATGGWQIDPAELHRAFPPVTVETSRNPEETLLRAQVAMLERTVEDLRARLDEERADRRLAYQLLAQAQERIALLSDQRPARRGWRFWR